MPKSFYSITSFLLILSIEFDFGAILIESIDSCPFCICLKLDLFKTSLNILDDRPRFCIEETELNFSAKRLEDSSIQRDHHPTMPIAILIGPKSFINNLCIQFILNLGPINF